MKIILSPSKSLKNIIPQTNYNCTQPLLISEAEELAIQLKSKTMPELKELMKISLDLAQLNFERFQNWNTPFTLENSCPCGWMFSGDAYRGLDYASFNDIDVAYSQKTLRILNGFYGILRPLDLIQPYRLEMGLKINLSNNFKNLYKFWGNKITNTINDEIFQNEVIVNLASNEYFKAINTKILKGNIVNCNFKEDRGGKLKMISSFAKKARGLMTRYIIENQLENADDLLGFNSEGYVYNLSRSSENLMLFTR